MANRTPRSAVDLAAAVAMVDAILPDGTHRYWSTHCRHGDHDLCKGCCKKCGPAAPCICPCHKSGTKEEDGDG